MLPTHRQSHGRTRRRRAHDSLTGTKVTLCPVTSMPKNHHRACRQSGYYRPGLTIVVHLTSLHCLCNSFLRPEAIETGKCYL